MEGVPRRGHDSNQCEEATQTKSVEREERGISISPHLTCTTYRLGSIWAQGCKVSYHPTVS